ncbi:unnamed protein product [Ilex paraguariensis]|uniref:tRNAHis guanylyltransferase catalytic domain-containing protein n=1 Tax=Ilex paraguariensis TaxID=185542 RepID=A0ABC8STA6_9AQUA
MNSCAVAVLEEFNVIVFSYGMSDEYSFVLKKGFEFYQRCARGVARVGEHLSFDTRMNIMDILYEKEETSVLHSSPRSLAACILAGFLKFSTFTIVIYCIFPPVFLPFKRVLNPLQVASYVITVPKQRWEFPVLCYVVSFFSFDVSLSSYT